MRSDYNPNARNHRQHPFRHGEAMEDLRAGDRIGLVGLRADGTVRECCADCGWTLRPYRPQLSAWRAARAGAGNTDGEARVCPAYARVPQS
jgi:hypothetical protein